MSNPTIFGLPMKYVALVTLTFQNSGLILVMHYSRIMPLTDGMRYYTSTAVLLNEVMKLLISLAMALYEVAMGQSSSSNVSDLTSAIFSGDSWKLAIPAMLYTLQNSLQYVAVSNLDAATYQVLSQLKILTTAIFSVILLGRTLKGRQWGALVVLMAGVAVVQVPPETFFKTKQARDVAENMVSHFTRALTSVLMLDDKSGKLITRAEEGADMNGTVGLIAVAIGCMLSGLAGVYFEKVLKDPKSGSTPSVWVRNIQLSFYSLFPALFIGVIFKDGPAIAQTGFFAGYNWVTWLAITFQATGGVLVALVVKYADNIAKNFATSFSIIVSFLASVYFFNFKISYFYIIGTILVIAATSLYNTPAAPKSAPKTIEEGSEEAKFAQGEGETSEKPLLSSTDSSERPDHQRRMSAPSEPSDSQGKREA